MNTVDFLKEDKLLKKVTQYWLCLSGGFLFSVGVNYLVAPLGLYNGGFVGMGQLVKVILERYFGLYIQTVDMAGVFYFLLNVPLFFLAYRSMSKAFFMKTIFVVVLQTVLLAVIPAPKELIIEDMLTGCLIGGIVVGVGAGLILRAGSSGGGQDILGVYYSKKIPGFSVGKLTIIINIFVYGVCALMFDISVVIYSLIYTVIMSLIIDKVHAQNVAATAMIFTKKKGLAVHIIEKMKRGVTEWDGRGGYTKEGTEVLMSVISKYEIQELKKIVEDFDKDAFVIISEGERIFGNYEKRLDF